MAMNAVATGGDKVSSVEETVFEADELPVTLTILAPVKSAAVEY